METILVVEDDPGIARLVHDYLVRAGLAVVQASSAAETHAAARASAPAHVVLDLGLPDRDGLDVLRELRGSVEVPIVILTARGDETDRVVGLELGADDYVVKPFSPKELVARVRAVLRRTADRTTATEVVEALDVVIDVPRRRVTVADRSVELTATEFALLETLARDPGRVITRGQLLNAVHGVALES